MGFLLVLVLVQQPTTQARITVRLPAEARLYVDDVLHKSTGTERVLTTPALEPGSRYSYMLKAEVTANGLTQTATRKVTFQAGEQPTVDFTQMFKPTPKDEPAPAPSTPGPKSGAKLSADEQAVLDLTNKERAKQGLAPFQINDKLLQAARNHSANMARLGQLDHTLDGKDPGNRLQEVGYRGFGWGENIAAGQRNAAEALNSWMNSPGHRANILNADFKEIGIGLAPHAGGGFYFTQVFGTPAPR